MEKIKIFAKQIKVAIDIAIFLFVSNVAHDDFVMRYNLLRCEAQKLSHVIVASNRKR